MSKGQKAYRCTKCNRVNPANHCPPCYEAAHPKSRTLELRRLRAEGKSKCSRCLRVMPTDRFDRRLKRSRPSCVCKDCRSAQQSQKRDRGIQTSFAERRELAALGLKKCSQCKTDKPLAVFGQRPDRPGGARSHCKECEHARNRQWRLANIDYVRAKGRERAAAGKASKVAPHKHAAHEAVHRALKTGRLVRPASCSCCGRSGVRIEGHHDDYAKQLEVVWLCGNCHALAHARHDAAQSALSFPLARKPSDFLDWPERRAACQ